MIALASGRIRLNVELKYNRDDPQLAAKVLELLRSEGVLDQCVITSLEYSAVREAKRLAPEVQVGLIVTKSIGDPASVEADFLSLNQDAVSARLLTGRTPAGSRSTSGRSTIGRQWSGWWRWASII